MNKLVLVATLCIFSTSIYAAAGGGKVNNPWQPVDPNVDVCTAFLPAGIDLDDCQEIASTTSGKTYLCNTLDEYTVVCPTDDSPGDNSDSNNNDEDED